MILKYERYKYLHSTYQSVHLLNIFVNVIPGHKWFIHSCNELSSQSKTQGEPFVSHSRNSIHSTKLKNSKVPRARVQLSSLITVTFCLTVSLNQSNFNCWKNSFIQIVLDDQPNDRSEWFLLGSMLPIESVVSIGETSIRPVDCLSNSERQLTENYSLADSSTELESCGRVYRPIIALRARLQGGMQLLEWFTMAQTEATILWDHARVSFSKVH